MLAGGDRGGTTHFLFLDVLRGLAALGVVLHHVAQSADVDLFTRAYVAVDLFFILSGFVVAHAYEPRFAGGLSAGGFLRRRLERLYPVLLLGSLVGIAIAAVMPGGYLTARSAAAQILLVPFGSTDSGAYPLNDVYWSLFFELAVNLVHVAIFAWLSTGRLVAIVAAGLVGLVWAADQFNDLAVGFYTSTFIGGVARVVFGYFAGVLIYRLTAAGRFMPAAVSPWVPCMLLALALLAPALGHPDLRDLAVVTVLCPLAVVAGLGAQVPRRWTRIATWVGLISFPLYAIHKPLLTLAAAWAPGHGDVRLAAVYWSAVILAVLAVATVVEAIYERPIRRLLASRRARDADPVGALLPRRDREVVR